MLQVYGKNKIFKISACYLKDKQAWAFEKVRFVKRQVVRSFIFTDKGAEPLKQQHRKTITEFDLVCHREM
jgi:hypothetical protein